MYTHKVLKFIEFTTSRVIVKAISDTTSLVRNILKVKMEDGFDNNTHI